MPKLFTLEEANALLPELRETLADLRGAVEELARVEPEVSALRWKIRGNGHNVPDEPFARQRAAREAVQRPLARIQALGCELKDPRLGLIDFPSRRGGEVVYLCWKLDEAEVAYWHPTTVGFAGRRRL
jgi:hypothetical protein